MVKPLPSNLSIFCCREFNSGLQQAGVPDFQKCKIFGQHLGHNLLVGWTNKTLRGAKHPHNEQKGGSEKSICEKTGLQCHGVIK